MTDLKLNLNIKLGEIRYLGVPDIIDYKLVQYSKIQNNGSNRIGWNSSVYRGFRGRWSWN